MGDMAESGEPDQLKEAVSFNYIVGFVISIQYCTCCTCGPNIDSDLSTWNRALACANQYSLLMNVNIINECEFINAMIFMQFSVGATPSF